MILKLTINSPPFSVNKAYYKNRQRTKECRAWSDAIFEQLENIDFSEFTQFVTDNINNVEIEAEYHFKLPRDKMYTCSGKVSRRGNDLSNVEKLLQDVLCDSRYSDRGLNNLNIDDTLITTLLSTKSVSSDNEYKINIIFRAVLNKRPPI